MRRRYMDAMSLVQRFGKPDLFITVTCNPNWPEIKELLKYVDEPQNRPDLLARVFHARLEELKNDIFKRHIFGEVAAYAYVIEFQKRGLPHAHFLIILKSKFKITTPAHCDRFISAEIPNKETEPHLYNLVKKHMIHGPCGSLNPNCPCMLHQQQQVAPSCKNKYPRSFNDETTFDENSYPIYRRMDTSAYVVVRGHQLDNRISLSLYAGADVHEFDEIKEYQSARWVSPPEAAWRIYAFPISEIKPAVVHLQVHLQNYQYINFHGNDRLSMSTQEKEDREIAAEYNIQVSEYDLLCVEKLNVEQCNAFDTIMASIISNSGGVYFIDGPGGTGKTFLYKCLLATVRSRKWIALATASSGIATSILPGGRTAHSTFKIPIDGDDKYVCNIGKRTAEATLLKKCRLILWDEASMANRRAIESVDITLRDIMDIDQIFGGKVVVFGGDFRQTLPVIRYGKKEDFIEASLVKSPLIWPTIRRLTLVQNIRANEDPAFCEYLMKIGDGTEQLVGRDKIKIPSSFIIPCTNEDTSLDALFQSVYPDLTCFETDPYSLMSKAILTPKNEIADEINSILIDRFPGESFLYNNQCKMLN
nr:ATP-dependent DNA helicase pif1-like [Ipomoea batatas]